MTGTPNLLALALQRRFGARGRDSEREARDGGADGGAGRATRDGRERPMSMNELIYQAAGRPRPARGGIW